MHAQESADELLGLPFIQPPSVHQNSRSLNERSRRKTLHSTTWSRTSSPGPAGSQTVFPRQGEVEHNPSSRGLQVMDETLGALVYMLKRSGQLGDGPAFTARLEVDYRKVSPLCTTPSLLALRR